MNIVERVEGCVPVALGGSVVVGRQERMSRSEVRPRALSEPANRADHTLVALLAFNECWAVVRFVGFRAGVDGEAGAVGSSVRCDLALMNGIIFDEVCRKTGLTEMNRDVTIETRPLEMGTEKPVDRAHEVNGDKPREELFKSTFNRRVF